MAYLAAALASASIGAMLFFSAIVAPTAFRALPSDEAAGFVRALFSTYFLVNGLAGLIAAALVFPAFAGALLFLGGGALIALRLLVVPAINAARDASLAGDSKAKASFKRWHRLSVLVNVAAIVLYAAGVWSLGR